MQTMPVTEPVSARPGTPVVSIIVPCRNEAATIGAMVRAAQRSLERCGYAGEVIVCDNASTDGSAAEALSAGARVVHQSIRGYGAACLRGMEVSTGEFIVIADGDGTYDLDVLHRFIEPLRAGYDMVLGTRRNGEIEPGAMRRVHRHFLEPVQTYLSRRFLHFYVSDIRCGLRSITRAARARLDLGATGMEFASEMVVDAARAGLRAVEVPVRFQPRPDGDPRRSVGDGWRVARQLLLLSPTLLFLIPGLVLLFAGLALELVLLPGPIRVAGQNIDFHFMFVGGAFVLLGLQLVLLGIYSKTYALVHDAGPVDPWIRRFHLHYTLERGVALGAILFVIGFCIDLGIVVQWIVDGRGILFAVRPAVLALTFMLLGAEILFASFFLSVLRAAQFGRT